MTITHSSTSFRELHAFENVRIKIDEIQYMIFMSNIDTQVMGINPDRDLVKFHDYKSRQHLIICIEI